MGAINEKGEFIGEPELEPENHKRYVSTGVVMNLNSAKSLYDWLGKHIDTLEKEKKIRVEEINHDFCRL
ncbi:hypothetical protein RZN22_01760 [Bacillaceae bacterium S4-13-58]